MKKHIYYAIFAVLAFAFGCLIQWFENFGPEWARY